MRLSRAARAGDRESGTRTMDEGLGLAMALTFPAAAGLMMSFVWVATDNGLSGDQLRWVAPVVTAFAALMMVSRFRFYSFKTLPLGDRVPFIAVLIAVGVFVALAIDPPAVLFLITGLYALSAPTTWIIGRIRRSRSSAGE